MNDSGFTDDELTYFEAHGVPPLPAAGETGTVENAGARVWYARFGRGPAVVLLHGGLGNAGNFAYQVPALIAAGYSVVAIDSRGQGRSTRADQPYSYELMASDARAVMDRLGIGKSAFVGWSDGADTALVLAKETPDRAAGVFFFACNVDGSGTLPFAFTERIGRMYNHHVRDYAARSPTPDGFERMRDDLGVMQKDQPNYGPEQLKQIDVPVWAVIGEHDEFIRRGHIEWLAATVPNGRFMLLPEVSHFAPLQRPALFNAAVLEFLQSLPAW